MTTAGRDRTTAPGGTPGVPGSGGVRLLVACLLGGSAGWAITATGAGARTIADAYGTDLLWVGLLSAALAAPYAAFQFPAGVLVDRWGVRRATTAGLSLVLVAHLAALAAPLPWLAVAARLVSGTGFAVCFVSGAELARSSGRGSRGMGLFGGIALAASGASVLGVVLAEPTLGWRAAWVTSAVVSAAALVGTVLLPESRVRHVPRPPLHTPVGVVLDDTGTVGSLFRDGQLFRLAGVHAATLGLGLILSTWATTLLVDVWSFGVGTAALVGSMVLGLSVISRPLGGHVTALYPHRNRLLWAVALLACAAGTLALAGPGVPAVAVVAVVVLGTFSGLPFAAVVQGAQARQPGRSAAAVGMMNTLAFGLVVVGTPAVGWAVDHDHARTALLALAVLWLLPLASLPSSPSAHRT